MSNFTSRLTLQEPIGVDLVSALRLAITNHALVLDNSTLVTEGTLAGRPAANTVEHSHVYRATDAGSAGQWAVGDGTNWLRLLTFGKEYFVYRVVNAGTVTANPGDWISAAAGVQLVLPSPAVANQVIAISAFGTGPTGNNPVKVGGTNIYGVGLVAATSFNLGTPTAAVILQSDGANWQMIAGRQDTGWVNLALAGGVTAQTGTYTPASRQVGDTVYLRGGLHAVGAIASGQPWASVPAPTFFVSFIAPVGNGAGGLLLPGAINSFAPLQIPSASTSLFAYVSVAAGNYIPLDNLSYARA